MVSIVELEQNNNQQKHQEEEYQENIKNLAVGADARDVMVLVLWTGIPHEFFFLQECARLDIQLPPQGQYAVGNVFLNPNLPLWKIVKKLFEQIAKSLNLKVLGWREVPKDNSILGPAAKSREPMILQLSLF
ncbi:glutamate synthase [Rhizophagus irregularis DAOM 181602=DAOM 197198]|nr:glutamate synthase [Rhizophagus irregularis DAOM 181602=DAOM 197198]